MDPLVEGRIVLAEDSIQRNVGFTAMTERLGFEFYANFSGFLAVVDLYLQNPKGRLSPATLVSMQQLRDQFAGLQSQVEDFDSEKAQQISGQPKVLVPRTPFTPYLRAARAKLGEAILARHCLVPVTTPLPTFPGWDWQREILATPDTDLESALASARAADAALYSATNQVMQDWIKLTQNADLDAIGFPDRIPLEAQNVASSAAWMLRSLLDVDATAREIFADDVTQLQIMISGIHAGGSLCIVEHN